jgi:hypothetical protein
MMNNSRMKRQFTGTTGKIILHILAWSILIVLPQYLNRRYFGNFPVSWWFYVNTATYLVIFYINYLILVPRFYFRGNGWKYFVSALVVLVAVYFVSEFSNDAFFRRYRNQRVMVIRDSTLTDSVGYLRILPDEAFNREEESGRQEYNENAAPRQRRIVVITPEYIGDSSRTRQDTIHAPGNSGPGGFGSPPDNRGVPGPAGDFGRFRPAFLSYQVYNYILSALFFTFFSLGLRLMERHAGIEKKQKELEKEKLNSELALLKNQISPHFFFNTLNNIYSLISINTEDSQNAVLKLSRLMRYLLYESEQGITRLSKEIEFMNNYIDLMRLRTSNKVSMQVNFPENYEDISLPPLLFIPFIENAFKHGISYRDKSFIEIMMKTENDNLVFRCTNSINGYKTDKEDNHNGIGLENVKKRLNLLFPERHTLKISKTEKIFDVELIIGMKDLSNG